MRTLIFGGSSDDTFGEVTPRGDDFDNCGSGNPIEWLIQCPATGDAVLVVGQYCPSNAGSWLVGVARPDFVDDGKPIPDWPIRIRPGDVPYTPYLEITVPDKVILTCMQHQGED